MDLTPFNITLTDDQSQPGSGTRKLAAIMFTDIKNFSGRMQRDEDAAMRMLQVHNTMMQSTVAKYSGKVVKIMGDAFLVSFNSVVSATQCALEAQQNFYQYNLQFKSDDDKILVRIGIHLGDVIETEKDIFGDGVNIASRLQSIAEAGGLTISESVYQQVKNKLNIRVLNLGVPQLKGIKEAIKVYQVIVIPSDKARGTIATNLYVLRTILRRKKTKRIVGIAAGTAALLVVAWYFLIGPQAPPNSLAIMPFKNIGDPANEYMADGLAEDINNYLSRGSELHIISSGTTQNLKQSRLSELDIARHLGVRYVLTGSFELAKTGRLSIRVRLTDPFDNKDLWNNTYRGFVDDIPNFEHEMIREIGFRFNAVAGSNIDENVPMAARDDYYQGLDYDRKQTKEDNQLAIASFQAAIDKYPQYIDAHIKLANCEIVNRERGYDLSEKSLLDAEKHINQAFQIDSTSPELFNVWGRLLIAKNDHKKGIEYLERCIQKNPNYMRAYINLGDEYLFNQNDAVKAIYYWTKAYELEPSNFNTSMNLGIAYAIQKNYNEAIKAFRRASILNASHDLPWYNLGLLYTITGAYDSAVVAYNNALHLDPENPNAAGRYASLLLSRGKISTADSVVSASLQYNPEDYLILYTRGYIKMREGKRDSSIMIWHAGLRLAETNMASNPTIVDHDRYAGLFSARLGNAENAVKYGLSAFGKDSSEENAIGLAKIYANLGDKNRMIEWFNRAREKNSEYDPAYIANDFDFEKFATDHELLTVAAK